jgi:hypothetical protein
MAITSTAAKRIVNHILSTNEEILAISLIDRIGKEMSLPLILKSLLKKRLK